MTYKRSLQILFVGMAVIAFVACFRHADFISFGGRSYFLKVPWALFTGCVISLLGLYGLLTSRKNSN
jgi:hypothetical protein